MNSNLQTNGYKELLLTKLSYAVISSVTTNLIVLTVFIFVTSFKLHLFDWFKCCVGTFVSFSTWLFLLLFSAIIFAQTIACAKDYVLRPSSCTSRLHRMVSVISFRNLVLLSLHVTIGGLAAWLYLFLSGQKLTSKKEDQKLLVENTLFIVLTGFWTGFYYAIFKCDSNVTLMFPVIHQPKLLHFKSNFLNLLRESKSSALRPTLYFFGVYYCFGSHLRDYIAELLDVKDNGGTLTFSAYIFAYSLAVIYFLNMSLMKFFFELFLTDPVEFYMVPNDNELDLASAMEISNLPIVQHLACLDFYRLSVWSKGRRSILFSLSQPGAHPHNWNLVLGKVLKIFSEFTQCINTAIDSSTSKERSKILQELHQPPALTLKSPLQQKFISMRNMSMLDSTLSPNIITYSPDKNAALEQLTEKSENVYNKFVNAIKNVPVIKYFFGELRENSVEHCLKSGQIIVWTTQGIANVAVASLDEDDYAVVQRDLPVIMTALVQLKHCMDKLNKMPAFSRRASNIDDFSLKMKNSIYAAVKRSLYNISTKFEPYLKDLSLDEDVLQELQCYL